MSIERLRFPNIFRASPWLHKRIALEPLLIHQLERCRQQAPGMVLGLNTRSSRRITVDPDEAATLEFVICEIVSNAYRHAHPQGEAVEVVIECGALASGEIVIEIGDDGVGLAPDF